MSYDRDSGHKSFLEDVFQNESRLPGGNWGPSSVPWTDVVSVASKPFSVVFVSAYQPRAWNSAFHALCLANWSRRWFFGIVYLFEQPNGDEVAFRNRVCNSLFKWFFRWKGWIAEPGTSLISLFVLLLIGWELRFSPRRFDFLLPVICINGR